MKENNSLKIELEVLTPLHIGSGNEFINGFDIIEINRQKKIINLNALIEHFRDKPEELNNLTTAIEFNRLSDFMIGKRNIPPEVISNKNIPASLDKTNIKKQIRNGNGELYLPGSSLKGVIRTALLHHFIGNDKSLKDSVTRQVEKIAASTYIDLRYADSGIIGTVLGQEIENNLLRLLQVSDALPVISYCETQVYQVKVLGTKRKLPIFCEMIPQGTKFIFSVTLDEYLNNHRKQAGINQERGKNLLKDLPRAMYNLAAKIIERHNEYPSKEQVNEQDLSEFNRACDSIYTYLEGAEKNDDFFAVLGGGSGWVGMTGDLADINHLKPEIKDKLRQKLELAADHTGCEFPKTRKLVLDAKNGASMPGWVKMKIINS